MVVRVCLPRLTGFYEISRLDGVYSVTGPIASITRTFLDTVSGLNYTLQYSDSMGTVVNKEMLKFDGCIGSLQRNESDVSFGIFNIPFMVPNITYTVVDGFDKMGILSGYYKSKRDNINRPQILDMVFAFTPSLWFLLFMTFGLIFLLLFMSLRIKSLGLSMRRKSNPVSIWDRQPMVRSKRVLSLITRAVISSVLKQYSAKPPSVSRYAPLSLLFMMMILLSFYSGYYMTSMIKTEMVVMEKPITVESYEDVLRMGKRPAWFAGFTDIVAFQNAADGTLEHEVWNKAISLGINDSLIQMTIDSFLNHGMQVAETKKVIFMSQFMGETSFPYAACLVSRVRNIMTSTYVLFRHDASAREILRFSIENHLISDIVSQRVRKRIEKIFEADLKNAAKRYIDSAAVFGLTNVDEKFRAIRECCSNVVTMPEPELYPVPPHHYLSLVLLTTALLCSGIVVLTIEMLTKNR